MNQWDVIAQDVPAMSYNSGLCYLHTNSWSSSLSESIGARELTVCGLAFVMRYVTVTRFSDGSYFRMPAPSRGLVQSVSAKLSSELVSVFSSGSATRKETVL